MAPKDHRRPLYDNSANKFTLSAERMSLTFKETENFFNLIILNFLFFCINIRNNVKGRIMELKLMQVGNSVGVILPKETLAKLKLVKGDHLWLTESPDGYRLTPYNPEFGTQMDMARKIMKKRRTALHELAK